MNAPIPIVICDDSSLARKQMARALSAWHVRITEAANGLEAIEAVRAGHGHLLFLDLNMPIMDGYQVLERIRQQELDTLVVVVSGDVQQEARERVLALGALGFVAKPIKADTLQAALGEYGLDAELQPRSESPTVRDSAAELLDLKEYYQELSNVAMGRAADLLARLLGVFVHLPIPRVQLIPAEEMRAVLNRIRLDAVNEATLCQGFTGPAIAGRGDTDLRTARPRRHGPPDGNRGKDHPRH